MIQIRLVLRILVRTENRADFNWESRSVVMVDGTPNVTTHLDMNALATLSAVMSGSGMASGHRVKRSMHVRM